MRARRLLSLLTLPLGFFGAQSCFTDNQGAYEGILGRSVRDEPEERRPPAPDSGGTGGSSGGSATGGSQPGNGGTGDEGGAGGETGMGGEGNGGTGATGGSGATTGIPEDNPPLDPNFSPACFLTLTQAGEEILKGTPCTSEDPPLCYRPCGPNQVGWKTETCLAGVYAEGDCTFPADKDYSCYSIPPVIDEGACEVTAPPAATDPCDAPLCMSCNFGGFYEDTGANAKEGFCTCREPDREGVRRWTCASSTAWPCPFSNGC